MLGHTVPTKSLAGESLHEPDLCDRLVDSQPLERRRSGALDRRAETKIHLASVAVPDHWLAILEIAELARVIAFAGGMVDVSADNFASGVVIDKNNINEDIAVGAAVLHLDLQVVIEFVGEGLVARQGMRDALAHRKFQACWRESVHWYIGRICLRIIFSYVEVKSVIVGARARRDCRDKYGNEDKNRAGAASDPHRAH